MESEGNNTSQSGTFESVHGKMVMWSMQTNSLSGFESQSLSQWAAFSSCVDERNLSAQFKMLRLKVV